MCNIDKHLFKLKIPQHLSSQKYKIRPFTDLNTSVDTCEYEYYELSSTIFRVDGLYKINEMDFESPDAEQTFPGLYAYDTGKRSNESDLSDDENGKLSKKDLLIGKRKDKDSKKDRGYAALEGESSPEEQEVKSPTKSKKTKSFKFASKKEKREKSREKEKDGKEKDKELIDKKKDRDKDRKGDRVKEKPKSEKKERRKHGIDEPDLGDEIPIFGVPLVLAVERYGCHDGVCLPIPVRECIDYVEENGMIVENVYKSNGVKSKVQQLKQLYNNRQKVNWSDYDVLCATSLLKLFVRELPDIILTEELSPDFEEASATQDVANRESTFVDLVAKLPECNRTLLAWLILHLDRVTAHEKITKMNAQCVAVAFSSVFLMSQRLIVAFLFHAKALFPDTMLIKYVPPLTSTAVDLPERAEDIAVELRKQESLLSQVHGEMNAGFVTKEREEMLWEVQRMITQLKRKLRAVQKSQDSSQNHESVDEGGVPESKIETKSVREDFVESSFKPDKDRSETVSAEITIKPELKEDSPSLEEQNLTSAKSETVTTVFDIPVNVKLEPVRTIVASRPLLSEEDKNILLLQFQNSELIELQTYLLSQIQVERNEINRLKQITKSREASPIDRCPVDVDTSDMIDILMKENQALHVKKNNLIREIMEEREECVDLQSQLLYIALSRG